MKISIPVSPFAHRCIRYEEGRSAVLNIGTRHFFYTILSSRPSKNKAKRAIKYCTETVTFNVPKPLAKQLSKNNSFLIGYLFHLHYQRQMLHQLHHTFGITGANVLPLLKTYLELRKISEDDYALETAYKAWQRYQIKNLEKVGKIEGTESNIIVSSCSPLKLSSDFIENQIYSTLNINKKNITGSYLQQQKYYDQRAVVVYLLHKLTTHSYRSLGLLFQIQYKHIYSNYKKVEFAVHGDHEETYNELVKTFKNKLLEHRSPIIREIVTSCL